MAYDPIISRIMYNNINIYYLKLHSANELFVERTHNLSLFYSYSAGVVFIRQNLISIDIRFWRLKSVPALKELKY